MATAAAAAAVATGAVAAVAAAAATATFLLWDQSKQLCNTTPTQQTTTRKTI